LTKRAAQEENLKAMLISALTWHFCFHEGMTRRTLPVLDTPSTRQQGSDLLKGSGKPYDLGVFYEGCRVLMLELKDRRDNDKFEGMSELDPQHLALKAFWDRGIQVWYAYNSWNWDHKKKHWDSVLAEVHALPPAQFKNPLPTPLSPAATPLVDLLKLLSDADAISVRLHELLALDPSFIDALDGHTLIVLANIDDNAFEIMETPAQLKKARTYFKIESALQATTLEALVAIGDDFGVWLATLMFGLAEELLTRQNLPKANDADERELERPTMR
jgi:hypothetical protein